MTSLRSIRGGRSRRARSGGRRSECDRDRHLPLYGHHSGDAQLYRGKDEVRRLREERDCLKHFRRRVGEAALLDMDALDAVEAEVAALIDRAVEMARAAPPPAEGDLLSDVYVFVLRESAMPQKSIRQALNEALAQEMRRDPTIW